jgi:hypothetical protein
VTDLTGGGDQRVVLSGFLDWYRAVAERKLDGLDRDEATSIAMPSGTTMLGIVRHLAWDERGWFGHHYSGATDEREDVDQSFVRAPDETVDSVISDYRAACARSRAIVEAAPSLDAPAAVEHRVFGAVTLRWIMMHMIEETARHAGHLDILRELTDGRTGD